MSARRLPRATVPHALLPFGAGLCCVAAACTEAPPRPADPSRSDLLPLTQEGALLPAGPTNVQHDTLRWEGPVAVGWSMVDFPQEVYSAIWARAAQNPELEELVVITVGSVVNKYGRTLEAPFCNTVLTQRDLTEARRYADARRFGQADHSMAWKRTCYETQFLRWADEMVRQTEG